jgi:hypothetical protein
MSKPDTEPFPKNCKQNIKTVPDRSSMIMTQTMTLCVFTRWKNMYDKLGETKKEMCILLRYMPMRLRKFITVIYE